ncbi:MAG: TraB/GumN family protein [Myxococcales bacterium]|nr:TraB/GumN family protein [Myxococcales bacterium]
MGVLDQTVEPENPTSDEALPANVRRIAHEGRTIWLVGTAHVSLESVNEVRSRIAALEPDAVCVELCQSRYDALTDPDRWKKLDIFKVFREGKALFLLANLAIGAYQRRIGKELNVEPGAELVAAAEAANASGATLALVDRDIHVTLKRTWATIGFWQKMRLLSAIMQSLIATEEISADDIEQLKAGDQLPDMMSAFTQELPEVVEPLIFERDRYMAKKIRNTPGETVVAVVGAAHVPGMVRVFEQDVDTAALEVIPPPSPLVRSLKWVIPAIIMSAFYFGWRKGQGQMLGEMVWLWVAANSVVAGVFTALAGGKLISVITSLFSSPITSLNPLLGTAMIVGPVEAWLRRPTVEDCERINDDVQSLAGVYRNPFTRVLLVAVMASLGSALGAWIGGALVVRLLAS